MQQEVEALLALQEDDLKIREIEAQIRELDPKLAEFGRASCRERVSVVV